MRSPGVNDGNMLSSATVKRESGQTPAANSSARRSCARSDSPGWRPLRRDDQLAANGLVRGLPLRRDALRLPEDLREALHLRQQVLRRLHVDLLLALPAGLQDVPGQLVQVLVL